jgi:hypothetical protein
VEYERGSFAYACHSAGRKSQSAAEVERPQTAGKAEAPPCSRRCAGSFL